MTAAYPPPEHMLRDLRFSFEHDVEGATSRAWMPVVEEVCTDGGAVRVGALATLVDVIGGGLAATAASPDWIATADLTVHAAGRATPGAVVEARARVLRAGRTTVVIEVGLDRVGGTDDGREIGIATMSFSVLPRRDANPDMTTIRAAGVTTMATDDSRLAVPLFDALGVQVRDPATGQLEVPITDWTRNSMGAMQGGVVAMVAEAAGEVVLRAATGEPLVVSDMHVTYLGFGRVGPVVTQATVLEVTPSYAAVRVEIADRGAEHREMTRVSVVATRDGSR